MLKLGAESHRTQGLQLPSGTAVIPEQSSIYCKVSTGRCCLLLRPSGLQKDVCPTLPARGCWHRVSGNANVPAPHCRPGDHNPDSRAFLTTPERTARS